MGHRLSTTVSRRGFLGSALAGGAALVVGCSRYQPLFDQDVGTRGRRVWVAADSHIGLGGRSNDGKDGGDWFELALAEQQANLPPVDYTVNLGDVTHHGGSAEELGRYVALRASAKVGPWLEIAGNHDHDAVPGGRWRQMVRRPARYVMLDGNCAWVMVSADQGRSNGWLSPGTLGWLRRQVAAHQDRNVIVCTHHPVYDTVDSSTDPENEPFITDVAFTTELLHDLRVDLWLNGHIHGGRRNSGYVTRRGRTAFVNAASIGHAYGTRAMVSYTLEMEAGGHTLLARCREHDRSRFVADQEMRVTVPHAWRFDARPRMTVAAG